MKYIHILKPHHHEHLSRLGVPWVRPLYIIAEDAEYQEAYQTWKRSLPQADHETLHTKALGHLAWKQHISSQSRSNEHRIQQRHNRIFYAVLLVIITLLCAKSAHCQFSHINTVQTKNGGTGIGFHASPFIINCSTNTACTDDGTTFTITASSTAATAWSAITAATNSNVGTFAMSGNTLDLTAATLVKLRVAGGLTTSVNGDLGYDSTAAKWLIWQGGANRNLIAATNLGSSGQPCMSNADGSCTFADPVVSQPTASLLNAQVVGNVASAASDSGNPVKTGCVFNTTQPTVTTGQRVDCQATARGEVLIAKGVTGFSVDNTAFLAKLQDASGNNINSTSGAINVFLSGTALSNQSVNLNQIAGTAVVADPCQTAAKNYTAISFSSTSNQKIVALASSKKTYVCELNLVVGAATNLVVITGTKTTNECDTSTAGVFGGTTAATGWNLAANGGIVVGSGFSAVGAGGTSLDVCMIASAANQVSGNLVWVQQ